MKRDSLPPPRPALSTLELQEDGTVLGDGSTADPDSTVPAGLERNPGIVATATHCVSAVPYACRAEPGIRTYLDLPLVSGRAAPELARGGA